MTKRAAALFCFFLAAGLLVNGAPARAQWCANNPSNPGLTCFGLSSLQSNSTGIENTAFGKNALSSNTSGWENTAVGDGALQSNTTGIANAAFGMNALGSNTSGFEDTAIGDGAMHLNTSGSDNTALGAQTLRSNLTGKSNVAVGVGALNTTNADGNTALGTIALYFNTSGSYNTAIGLQAMGGNTTGGYNTAAGYEALLANTSGANNVALGMYSLKANTTGIDNTAVGPAALMYGVSGFNNVAVGLYAGAAYTGAESYNVALASYGVAGESGVIRIGTIGNQSKAFVAGIYGSTASSGIPVYVNSAGQLGTVTSSLRYKEDVADLGAASDELMKLRPVSFRYKTPYDDGQRLLQYGLIAEEVAAVDPGLVQYGDDGQPLTVRYHFVNALLLGEVQKQHATIAGQAAEIGSLKSTIANQNGVIAALAERLGKLEAAAAPRR